MDRVAHTAERYGIAGHYYDIYGSRRTVPHETQARLLAAMGVDPDQPPTSAAPPPWLVPAGQTAAVRAAGEVQLEDGGQVKVSRQLPADLPLGYHRYIPADGPPQRLIIYPPQCVLPDELRAWGWAIPLYAVRSAQTWGLGDLRDLRVLGDWSRGLGAEFLLLNPLYASAPVAAQEPSPYQPTSRLYRNPLYLAIDQLPGAAEASGRLAELAGKARGLNAHRRIDRDAVHRLKMEALQLIWSPRHEQDPRFVQYVAEQGRSLEDFATFCVLAERFGGQWQAWPAEYRRPEAQAVDRVRREQRSRIRFFQWVQWLIDQQLAAAAQACPLVHDLPIGSDPGGADAWMWQDALAAEVSVGAPPDRFNTQGQDWGAAPFIPHRLRELEYEPLIQTVRASMRHACGVRIDHVMGLFRLFWIPRNASPDHGAYVRYPADELLAIVALESHRQGAWVAGEDLGTVEPEVRDELARQRILSHRILWFEDEPPRSYPWMSLAAVTTHDLPTIAGLWSGSELETERRLGRDPKPEEFERVRRRLCRAARISGTASEQEAIVAAHRALADAPSAVRVANLTDALAVEERLNMPGKNEWPSWSLALPIPLEEILRTPLPHVLARLLQGDEF